MTLYLDNLDISYSYKDLILSLNEKNISYKKKINYITFNNSINNQEVLVTCFFKSNIIYRVIITGSNKDNDKILSYLKRYGEFKENDDNLLLSVDNLDILYSLNSNSNMKNFYIRFDLAYINERKFSKVILLFIFIINFILFGLIYLLLYFKSGFNYIELVSAIALVLIFTVLDFSLWFFFDNHKEKDKRVLIKDDDIDSSFIKKYELFTNYGNKKYDLKLNPINLYFYKEELLIILIYKNKPLSFKNSYNSIYLNDKTLSLENGLSINIFVNKNEELDEIRKLLDELKGSSNNVGK